VTRDRFSRIWLLGVAGFGVLLLLDILDIYSPPSLLLAVFAGILLFLSSFVARPWDAKREAQRKAGR
jgi:hypothetical protein